MSRRYLWVGVCAYVLLLTNAACENVTPLATATGPGLLGNGADDPDAAGAAGGSDGIGQAPELAATPDAAADAGAQDDSAVGPDVPEPPDLGVPPDCGAGGPDGGPRPDAGTATDTAVAPPDTGAGGADTGPETAAPGGLCAAYLGCGEACGDDADACWTSCYYAADFPCRVCIDRYSECLLRNGCMEASGNVDLGCFYRFCYRAYDLCFEGDVQPFCEDGDGDGRGLFCDGGGDCDDGDPAVFPGSEEVCNGKDDDCDGSIDEKLVGCAVRRSWAILVYMAGDNDLGDAALTELEGLARAGGSNGDVAVAVQLELGGQSSFYADHLPAEFSERTWRMVLSPTAEPTAERLLQQAYSIGDVDMTDPRELSDFLDWGAQAVPAERTLVVLWDHGGGWTGALVDDGSLDFMSLPRIREGLDGSFLRPDVLAWSACVMGAIEVVAELQGRADYLVASEEVSFGLPLDELLRGLRAAPTTAPREAALLLQDAAVRYAGRWNLSFTFATFDLSLGGPLVAATQELGRLLAAHIDDVRPLIERLLPDVQAMALTPDRDLADFATTLAVHGTGHPDLDAQAADVAALAVDPAFLVAFAAADSDPPPVWTPSLADAHGLSIFLPRPVDTVAEELETYRELAFAAGPDAGWDEFLEAWLGDAPLGVTAGDFRFELRWQTVGAPDAAVDIDLFVYEPQVGVAAPYWGEWSPLSGTFSADSLESGEAFEWFAAEPQVHAGSWLVLAVYQDTGAGGPAVRASLDFRDGRFADNDVRLRHTLSLDRPCFLGEGMLGGDVVNERCSDVWFVGKLVRDGDQHTLMPGVYGDFALPRSRPAADRPFLP